MGQLIVSEEASTPTAPGAGKWKLYPKNGGWFVQGSSGLEVPVLLLQTSIEGLKLVWNSLTSISVGTGRCLTQGGDFIDVTSTLTASGLSLTANTWYHVYLYLNSGSPAMEVVTTAPALWKNSAYSKSGVVTRRYVGSIMTNATGGIFQFLHENNAGIMRYVGLQIDSVMRVLNDGKATVSTSVSLAAKVPVTTTSAILRIGNNEATQVLYMDRAAVSTTSYYFFLSANFKGFMAEFPLSSSQTLFYVYTGTPVATGLYLDVLGYRFDR